MARPGRFPDRARASRRRKALGQHFLRNAGTAEAIVRRFAPAAGEPILEVGPGRGALTQRLLSAGAIVVAIERDPALAEDLRSAFRPAPIGAGAAPEEGRSAAGLIVATGDARTADLESLLRPALRAAGREKARAIGNLPYSAGTEIVSRLLLTPDLFSSIFVMLQREVADRIVAPPGGRTYGSLSVLAQYFTTPRIAMRLGPGSFDPPPGVDSAVVEMPFREERELPRESEPAYARFIRSLFTQRRRTLPHNLVPAWGADRESIASRLRDLGIDPGRRPETLTREECLRLCLAAPL